MSLLQEIIVPKENVNDEYVIVNSIYFKNGAKIKKGDIIASIETSKADFSIESEYDGYISYNCKEADELPVGDLIARVYDTESDLNLPEVISPSIGNKVDISIEPEFSKSALELVLELGIEKTVFGNTDFVTKADVQAYLESLSVLKPRPRDNPTDQGKSKIFPGENMNVLKERISSHKKREIAYLDSGQNADLTCNFSINVDNRGLLDYARKNHSIFRLTIIPTIILEVSKLLEKFPLLNAYYANEEIVRYNDINIGYAIDIDQGLKVVTLYNTNKRSIKEIETILQDKIDTYSKGALDVSDLSNASFTITDLSNSGIHYFQPLINKNQSAILGVSSVDLKNNTFNISVTFDHRVTEGKVVAAFLDSLKKNLEKLISAEKRINHIKATHELLSKVNKHIEYDQLDSKQVALLLKELLENQLK